SEDHFGGDPSPKADTPRLDGSLLECGVLHGSRALHNGDADCGRLGLLLPSQSSALRNAIPEATDPTAMEGRDPGIRHQLLRAANCTGSFLLGLADGGRGLWLPPALLRQTRRPLRSQEERQGARSFRLSQSQDRVPATTQRRNLLPQRDDLFR